MAGLDRNTHNRLRSDIRAHSLIIGYSVCLSGRCFIYTKMLPRRCRIRCAKKRAINGKQAPAVPEVILIFLLSTVFGRQREEFPKRFIAEPLAGLGNRAGGEGLTFLRT